MKKFIILSFIIISSFSVLSQDLSLQPQFTLPPPPEASALFKSTEIPVSHTTGVPSIGIPIYEIQLKEMTIPISLKYNSSGIRVDEVASSVGLGWALEAGGMISTMVVGTPDFEGLGYMDAQAYPEDREMNPIFGQHLGQWQTNADYDLAMLLTGHPKISNTALPPPTDVFNMEPDIYYYSLAGRSGKFFHNKNGGTAHPIPFEPLKIERLNHSSYRITDEKGTIYTYDIVEEISTSSAIFCSYEEFGGGSNLSVSKTYHLSKIETIYNEIVNFTYKSVQYSYDLPQSFTRYKLGINQYGFPQDVEVRQEMSSSINGKLIETISYNGTTVYFNYETCARFDLPSGTTPGGEQYGSYALKNIKISRDGKENNYYLNHSYYNLSSYVPCNTTGLGERSQYRLKLNSVQKNNEPSHQFEYYGNNFLPNRLDITQSDHWGYYKQGGGKYSKDYVFAFFDGGDRNPSENDTKLGVLSKITYPTGGYSLFDYELNDYYGTQTVVEGGGTINKQVGLYYSESQSEQSVSFTINNNLLPGSLRISYAAPEPPLQADPQFHINLSGNGFGGYYGSSGTQYLSLPIGTYTLQVSQVGVFEEGYAKMDWVEKIESASESITGNFKVGGLRIKQITDYPKINTSPATKRIFSYAMHDELSKSSGRIVDKPKYSYPFFKHRIELNQDSWQIIRTVGNYTAQNSKTVQPLNGMQGYHIMYTDVRVSQDEGSLTGYTDYKYSHANDIVSYVTFPATMATSYDWMRGLLIEKNDYKKNSGNSGFTLLSKLQNTYKFNYTYPSTGGTHFNNATQPNENHALGMKISVITPQASLVPPFGSLNEKREGAGFEISTYKLLSVWNFLESSSETFYDVTGGNPLTVLTNYFHDNSTHSQRTRIEKADSKGNKEIIRMRYPDDVESTTSLGFNSLTGPEFNAIGQLKKNAGHRIGTIVQSEKEIRTGSTLLSNSAERINFKLFGDRYLPENIKTIKGIYNATTNKLEDRMSFLSYDSKGNPLELKPTEGSSTVYIWGYNKQFLIAEIKNATKAEIEVVLGLSLDNLNESHLTSINNLRTHINMTKAMITTYTYEPLLGVTSITDPKGDKVTYHYDPSHRLEYIKDVDSRILKQFKYNYASN